MLELLVMEIKMARLSFIVTASIFVVAVASVGIAAPRPGYPVTGGTITQGFDVPWSENLSKRHTGLDISAHRGDPVYAVKPGKFYKTGDLGTDLKTGQSWGHWMIIMNDDGTTSGYLHLDLTKSFDKNLRIKAGEQIATVHLNHVHLNDCLQVAGCQHGAFPNDTFPKGKVTSYYRRPQLN